MKSCLAIVNQKSYGGRKIPKQAVENYLKDYQIFWQEDNPLSLSHDALFICGGDGTFNVALNRESNLSKDIFYLPCGTLNDKAHCYKRGKGQALVTGQADGARFGYVLACGTFTSIGYTAKEEVKKKCKRLAYCLQALKEYKVHKIKATFSKEGKTYSGEYTLILVIKSKYCFGFPFNRLYSAEKEEGHILLIKSPKRTNLLGKIKIFFPLFRAFFLGFGKEYHSKNMDFLPFNRGLLELSEEIPFCIDGDKKIFVKKQIPLSFQKHNGNFTLCKLNKRKGKIES